MLFADGSTMILLSIYFRYITKDWLWFQIYGVIALSVSTLACFILPESPKFLYSYKRYDEARNALKFIARFNRKGPLKKQKFDTEIAEERARV
jgi:hypothetical protein